LQLVFSPFRNPTVWQHTGDTTWTKVVGYPANNVPGGAVLITVSTSALATGSGCWVQMNEGSSAPSNTSKAFPLHAGATLLLGGGVSDIWIQLATAGDLFVAMWEG